MIDKRWAEVRHKHGGVYITAFPDGLLVPWKPLSVGEFLHYDQQITRCLICPGELENEVFTKCVQDKELVDKIDTLNAGIVTTVVQNIWEYSGPDTPAKLQEDFEYARQLLQGTRSSLIHECANMIATGFNYTLEQVYAMDYETFMLRLAQAEHKMLLFQAIREPFSFYNKHEQDEPQFAPLNKPQPRKSKVDAYELWRQQQQQVNQQKPQPKRPQPPTSRKDEGGKWWKISPVLEAQKRHPISFRAEQEQVDDIHLDSHERQERGAMRKHIIESRLANPRAKMVDDARVIYKDLIETLEKSKK